jgi:hypothetical protein
MKGFFHVLFFVSYLFVVNIYTMGKGGSFPRGKAAAAWNWHSLPPSAEAKDGGTLPPLTHMPSWHSAELIKHKDNITFHSILNKARNN